jgi:hypothetical protein
MLQSVIETFLEENLTGVILVTFVTALVGFAFALLKEGRLLAIRARFDSKARVLQETRRMANPILSAVEELQGRLIYILEKNEYAALSMQNEDPLAKEWENWERGSGSYEYYMPSTVYLFGQYFAWVRMLEESLREEAFQSQRSKDDLFYCIDEVGKSLRRYPAHREGKDSRVFQLQQRALGELLILREADSRRCMGYAEFLTKWRSDDQEFKPHLEPFVRLLKDLRPDEHKEESEKADLRWVRLKDTEEKLDELRKHCENLLRLQASRRIGELRASD